MKCFQWRILFFNKISRLQHKCFHLIVRPKIAVSMRKRKTTRKGKGKESNKKQKQNQNETGTKDKNFLY